MGIDEARHVRAEALEEGLQEQTNVTFCPFGRCGGREAAPEQRCVACKRWDKKGILPRTQGICYACLKTLVPITKGRGDWAERTYHKSCWKSLGFPRTPEDQVRVEFRIAEDEADPAGAPERRRLENARLDEERKKRLEEERVKQERERKEQRAKEQADYEAALEMQRGPFLAWAKAHASNIDSVDSLNALNERILELSKTPVSKPFWWKFDP